MKRRKPSHGRAWCATALILGGAAAAAWRATRDPLCPAPPGPAAGRADWFMALRVPEITTQYESGVEVMRVRLGRWLSALGEAGFAPMLLSDALAGLRAGRGLPENSVVLAFSPGRLRSYEVAAPIFRRRRWPLAWLARREDLRRADRRYPTAHAMRLMSRAGWDAGFVDADGAFRLRGPRAAVRGRWSAKAGARAVNLARRLDELEFLQLNGDWTAEDLVARLLAEKPARGTVCLGKALIQSREWGVTLPAGASGARFDLRTPPAKRGARLFWLGTAGLPDFRLRVRAQALSGEMRLLLRYDEATNEGLLLTLGGRDVAVDALAGPAARRLAMLGNASVLQERPFDLDIVLSGRRLSLAVDGGQPRLVDVGPPPASGRGLVQLQVLDRMRGIARAQGLRLTFVSGASS